MTDRYQIKRWDHHFETAQSRRVAKLQWVGVPNKQHGLGLTWILEQEDGAAIYGIWCLLIGACSHQSPPREGWLTVDGSPNGDPWTAHDLSKRWRRPISEIRRALSVLSGHKVGWIRRIGQLGARSERAESPLLDDAQCLVQSSPGQSRRGEAGPAGRDAPADPALTDQDRQRAEVHRILRRSLARHRLAATPDAFEEWLGLFTDAGCVSGNDAQELLRWLKIEAKQQGIAGRYARDYEGLLLKWRARQKRNDGVA